jgi:hypothetical protein
VTSPETGAGQLVADQLAGQLATLELRLTSVNRPGNLDGLFAHHVLRDALPSFAWDVDPLTGLWLDQNADRLRNAPQLAVLGYGLTHFGRHRAAEARTHLADGLRDLMRRDPFPADGVTFAHDPRQLLGIALAATVLLTDLPEVRGWLLDTVEDTRFRGDGPRVDLIRQHIRGMLTDQPVLVGDLAGQRELADRALVYWMLAAGTVRLADPAAELPLLQREILSGLLSTDAAALSACDAAVLRAAAGRIVDASIDSAVLSRSHIGVVLRRFPAVMKRWRWDDPADVQHPIRWEVNSEREVQDIVWILLRGVFDDLVDEEPLPRLGHSSYRSDFGIPRLGMLIEIKYVRSAAAFRKVEKEVIEDSVAYLRERTTYKKIVVFIYDASSSVQEHDVTTAALLDLEHVIDVVIVCRPSQLPPPGTDPTTTPSYPAAQRSRPRRSTPS